MDDKFIRISWAPGEIHGRVIGGHNVMTEGEFVTPNDPDASAWFTVRTTWRHESMTCRYVWDAAKKYWSRKEY